MNSFMANLFGQRTPLVNPNSVVGAPKTLRTELTHAPKTGLDPNQPRVKVQALLVAKVAPASNRAAWPATKHR